MVRQVEKNESDMLGGEDTGRVLGCYLLGRAIPARSCLKTGSPALADLAQGRFG